MILIATLLALSLSAAGGQAPTDPTAPTGALRADSTLGGPRENFFFHPSREGSNRLITPLRLILNGGFGIMQLDNVDNHVFDVPYREGFRNVWRNITDPIPAIESIGWRAFLFQEILPFNVEKKRAQYWPNSMNHLIGGGMSFRMMTEWFGSQG